MTRQSYSLNFLLMLLPLLLGACAAAPHEVPEDLPAWRKNVDFADADRVGWGARSDVFGKGFQWRVGDRVLYALTRYNQGDIQKRLIEIEVEELAPELIEGKSSSHVFSYHDRDGKKKSLQSMNMDVRVTISDAQGTEISSTLSSVPEAYLRLGFYGGCKAASELAALRQSQQVKEGAERPRAPKELYEAVASLHALFAVLAGSASLRPILEEVVERPPLLMLLPALFSGKITIGVSPDFAASKKVAIPGQEDLEAYSFPMTLSINGYPGLHTRVLVAPPEILAPLGAGVVAVEGRHPSNKEIWLSMHLLGSRRGPLVSRSDSNRSNN